MRLPRSLQARLALSVGVVLTILWVMTATLTALIVRNEVNEVLDNALQETAARILPLAATDIIGRDQAGTLVLLSNLRGDDDENYAYIIRDDAGRVLLRSSASDPTVYPTYDGIGFRQNRSHRFYNDAALQDTIRITIAEPLEHRAEIAGEVQLGLGLPLLIVLPLVLAAVVLAMRQSLEPLQVFRDRLDGRGAHDLSEISTEGLPSEISPLGDTLNTLLGRFRSALEAERSFAANAAHELRTPLAGAIAQIQRLRAETEDPAAIARAEEIEFALKRLTRLSERLMQLARAEGGRLQRDDSTDLRAIARVMVDDIGRINGTDKIALTVPDTPVMSSLDPDAFGILCRNLVENALRHGAADAPIAVSLTRDGTFTVANDGATLPADALSRLTTRFERADANTVGSGLGLAIVAAIADRLETPLVLQSPRTGATSGFQASITLPIDPA